MYALMSTMSEKAMKMLFDYRKNFIFLTVNPCPLSMGFHSITNSPIATTRASPRGQGENAPPSGPMYPGPDLQESRPTLAAKLQETYGLTELHQHLGS
jgi:hypothetical protein